MYVYMYVYENNRFFSSQVSVLLESLREQEQSLQYMLVFFDEISALKSHQGQGRTACHIIRWPTLRNSLK